MEDMLLVGDLLEVTTDETTQLWQVIVIIHVHVHITCIFDCHGRYCKLIRSVYHII